jgi:hypothetical protein
VYISQISAFSDFHVFKFVDSHVLLLHKIFGGVNFCGLKIKVYTISHMLAMIMCMKHSVCDHSCTNLVLIVWNLCSNSIFLWTNEIIIIFMSGVPTFNNYVNTI